MRILYSLIFLLATCSCTMGLLTTKKNILINCGYTTDAEKMYNSIRKELDIYDPQPGETIADVGFGAGWLEGVMMIFYDSLNLYLEEIGRYDLRSADYRFSKFLELRKTPNTNRYTLVKGEKDATMLPRRTFDKVILRETFHHFEEMDIMLKDIAGTLKEDGKLFVLEPFTAQTRSSNVCKTLHYSSEDLTQIFERNGFRLVEDHDLKLFPWWADFEERKMMFVFEVKQ